MSRKPYRVHHWTVGSRFSVPVPAGNIIDFTIEREPRTEQLFCAWVESRNEGMVSVRWSRAPELYAAWRKPNSVAHENRGVFAPEIRFAKDRLLLTYLAPPVSRPWDTGEGECVLHWKRITGGPWSEGVVARTRVRVPEADDTFPHNRLLHSASDPEGRNWALVVNNRFIEPTYALYSLNAPERALMPPNPWEDDLIYTGIIAGAADKARLVWDRGTWHIVRRGYDEQNDAYTLEAIALDMSILRHDHNEDGQADVIDAITEIYDDELLYMLWAEADLVQLHEEVGTFVAVLHPNQRSGRVDPSAKHVFETATSLAHIRTTHPRGTTPLLEAIGRGQRVPIDGIRQASSPRASSTQWQQNKPDSVTYAVEAPAMAQVRNWLNKGMVIAERNVFSNASSFEGVVEWREGPAPEKWTGHAHVIGHNYGVTIAGIEPLQSPSRHRSPTWVGKLYTHRIFCNFTEHAPLTDGLRIPLISYDDEQRFVVVGVAEVVSFE